MFLSTMMHETGNPAAVLFNKDYSGAGGVYAIFQPPEDEIWGVKLMTGVVEAGTKFKPGDFGDITNGLTVGLNFEVANDDGPYLQLGGGPVKTNENLFYLMTKIDTSEDIFDTVNYMYKFEVDFGVKGEPIVLDGDKNQRLQVYLNDNLSSLTTMLLIGNGFRAVHGTRSIGLINARYILPIKDHGA